MMTTWILVAHGSAAKLLGVKKNGKEIWVEHEFTHPKTSMKGADIYTDRMGRSFESSGPMRHAMDYSQEPSDHERRVFAKEISDHLSKSFAENKFSKLILVASPSLLGELRNTIDDSVAKVISHQLNKDLLSQEFSDAELIEKIRNDLGIVSL